MSREQARLLRFALRYPDQWHGYGKDCRECLKGLERHGLIQLSDTSKQFRLNTGANREVNA